MSLTPATPAPAKVSLLHRIGNEIAKIIGLGQKIEPLVTAGVGIASLADPALAVPLAAANGIFEKAVSTALAIQGSFAAVGQATNNAAKLQALLTAIGPDLDAYVQAALPGSASVLQAEQYINGKTALANAIVAFVNSVDATSLTPVIPPATIAAASAAVAAVEAAIPPKP